MEPYITVSDFLKKKILPISKNKIYELVKTGRIPAYNIGGRVLLLESEVWAAIKKKAHLRVIRYCEENK